LRDQVGPPKGGAAENKHTTPGKGRETRWATNRHGQQPGGQSLQPRLAGRRPGAQAPPNDHGPTCGLTRHLRAGGLQHLHSRLQADPGLPGACSAAGPRAPCRRGGLPVTRQGPRAEKKLRPPGRGSSARRPQQARRGAAQAAAAVLRQGRDQPGAPPAARPAAAARSAGTAQAGLPGRFCLPFGWFTALALTSAAFDGPASGGPVGRS